MSDTTVEQAVATALTNEALAERLRSIIDPKFDTLEQRTAYLHEAATRIEQIKSKSKRAAIAVRYLHDGKPMSDTQNKLSSVAWFYAKNADGTRMSVGEFRTYLAEHGVADPNVAGWSCTMPSGVVISTIGLDASVQLTPEQEEAQAQGMVDAVLESAKSGPNAEVTRSQRGANLKSDKATSKRTAKSTAKKAPVKKSTPTKQTAKQRARSTQVNPIPKKAAASKR